MPYGWKINREGSFPTVSERRLRSKSYKAFTLRPKRHAVIDFAFKIDNAVEGHVYDQNGRALANAGIALMPEKDDVGESSQFTNRKGRFKFESVTAGRYKLIVHEDKPGSALTRASYYDPQKSKQLTALIVDIKHGESMRGLKIFVPTTARKPGR